MEVPSTEEKKMASGRQKGGLVTMPFILANESFEKVASYGLLPNMILYLIADYHMGVVQGTNILLIWSAATNFTPVVGAFLSDSFLGRFLTIFFGSIFSLLGTILMWSTTVIPNAKPPPCNNQVAPQSCGSPTAANYALLYSAFTLMSIGAGGVRPCSMAFGADQIDVKENPNAARALERFFAWYYATSVMAVLVAFTGVVYVQEHYGWRIGFGVPVVLMFLSTLLFVVVSPLYYKRQVERSLLTSFCQVISAAWKNRKLTFPSSDHDQDSSVVRPTERLRFLNKACIRTKPEATVCTVEQVEELKALIRVLPMWSSGIMVSVNINQGSFPVLQAKTMNRHLGSGFQIPAGSFAFFSIAALMVWVVLYDCVILPLLSKLKGNPVHISVKLRMGVGLVFSIAAMAVSGVVEHVRRAKAAEEGFSGDPGAVIRMSAMWLVPQHVLNGLAEALNLIGQLEFYYSEFPKSMSSIAGSLYLLGIGVGSLLATFILNTVDGVTKGEGKESWVSTNINKGHYDKYYWLLAIMSCLNLVYYLVCSWAYGPSAHQKGVKGGNIMEEEHSQN